MGDVRVLILDEPTSALTDGEERILFEAVRRATRRGVGVVYVTHRLNEVFRIADRVTVFRDGRNAGHFRAAETDMQAACRRPSSGRATPFRLRKTPSPCCSDPCGRLIRTGLPGSRPVRRPATTGWPASTSISGPARSTASRGSSAAAGPKSSRRSSASAPPVPARSHSNRSGSAGHKPPEAIARGIALVPEDRHVQGLVLEHSIARNLTLAAIAPLLALGLAPAARGGARRRGSTCCGWP